MKELVLPVPETVSATYTVPVPSPVSTVEARRLAGEAVEARLTGPLRTLTAERLAKGAVKVKVEAADTPPSGLLDKPLFGTPEQRVFLTRARAFVHFSATQRASLIGVQERKARGPAAALAVGLGAPVLDSQALQVLTAQDALAALPDTALTIPASRSDDMTVGLTFNHFDPAHSEDSGGWLTVCPPADWGTSWEDFIADTCHGLFGFEKPRWHYMPEFGALLDALDRARQTLPEARSRFLRGDLPPDGRLVVRYETAGTDEFQWARVESWEDAGHPVVRDVGRELAPGVRPGPPVIIETGQIADWGIWVNGRGVVEGAATEGVGHHLS